jgi:hypothetical protein
LEDASWIDPDQNTVTVHMPGILLTGEAGIQTIMFLDAIDSTRKGPEPTAGGHL